MKMLFAVFAGAAAAAVFAFGAFWTMSGFSATPSVAAALAGGPGIPLLLTAISVILGAFLSVRIHPSAETLSAYATIQLFFGPLVIRDFWLGDAPWYAVVALLIVLPLTFVGGLLGSRKWLEVTMDLLLPTRYSTLTEKS